MSSPQLQSISSALNGYKPSECDLKQETKQEERIKLSDQEQKTIMNKIRALYQEKTSFFDVFLSKKLVYSKDKSLKIDLENLNTLTEQALKILKEETLNTIYLVEQDKTSYCLLTRTKLDLSYCLHLFKIPKKSEKKARSWTPVQLLSEGKMGYLRITSNSRGLFDPQRNQTMFKALYGEQYQGLLPTIYFSADKKICYQVNASACVSLKEYLKTTSCLSRGSKIKKLLNDLFEQIHNLHKRGYVLLKFGMDNFYIEGHKPVLIDFRHACKLPQEQQDEKLSKSKTQKTILNLSVLSPYESHSHSKLIQNDYAWLAYLIASAIGLVKEKTTEKQKEGKAKTYSITLYTYSNKLNNFIGFLADAEQKITPEEFDKYVTNHNIPREVTDFLKTRAIYRAI